MSRRPGRGPRLCSILLTASLVAGCGRGVADIAVILPETGPAAAYGLSLRRGMELAWAQTMASAEAPPFTLTFADSASDPERARALAAARFDDGALLVVGGATSGEALAMVAAADRFDRVLLSPSASSPELTGVSPNFFRIFPSEALEATRMANFASQTLGLAEVAVIAEGQVFGRGLREVFTDEFARYGGTVVASFDYPPGTLEFTELASRVLAAEAPGVYLIGFESSVGDLLETLIEGGYAGRVLTTHALAQPATLIRIGNAAEGVMLTQTVFEVDSDYAHIRAFVDAFVTKYEDRPDIFAAHGYDTVTLLAKALAGRPQVTSEVRKGLRALADFPGVTGSIQFDERGDVKKYPRIYIVGDDLTLYNYDAFVLTQKRALISRLDALRDQQQAQN